MNLFKWFFYFTVFLFAFFLNALGNRFEANKNSDFKPGEKILFEDDFQDSKENEFPAHWQLIKGHAIVRKKDNKNFCFITKDNYGVPLLKPDIKRENYLPESFTVEFDFYAGTKEADFLLFFKVPDKKYNSIHFGNCFWTRDFPYDRLIDWRYFESHPYVNLWHHGALTYNKGKINAYLDSQHVMIINNCEFIPLELAIGGTATTNFPLIFGNFKLAEKLKLENFNTILNEGKLVSHAIQFDINKSEIKLESLEYLKELAEWLVENPTIRLEIGGHTDSDGDLNKNLKLSRRRATAVKKQLELFGIEASRLNARGYGQSKPLDLGNTVDSKSQNRRVEFKKI